MGLFIHHAFIVTGNDFSEEKLIEVRDYAISLGFDVTEIVQSSINCFLSFMIAPDGSKEFREESENFNVKRNLVINSLEKNMLDWVLVEYSECKSKVVQSSRDWED